MINKFIAIVLVACGIAQTAAAVSLVPMSSQEGLERLTRSTYKVDFAKLSGHYLNQTDRIICGPVVASIVLNALRYNTPKAPLIDIPAAFLAQMPTKDGEQFDPRLRMYTPSNVLNEKALTIKSLSRIYAEPINGVRDAGVQLEQFRQIFEQAHDVRAKKISVGSKATARNLEGSQPLPAPIFESVMAELKKNLSEADNYVVANYSRAELKQPGTGHFSPVAAYDEKSNSFLILDVNPFGGPWVWVPAQDFINALNTFDTVENRGLLLISEK
jgi:hypothetical protein